MTTTHHYYVSGAEMISRAALDAGVSFFAGYPITPVNAVYSSMLEKLQSCGKAGLGVSDEISAISLCIGASMRGAKAMTATSAPGFCLMIENLGYAFMTETPLLIVLGQRLGPSTGAATQNGEGDILLTANAISGGYHIPVIAPNSITACYELTIKAINISEKYRTPVILLTQKDILMSYRNIDSTSIPKIKVTNRKPFDGEVYKTYDFEKLTDVPPFIPAGSGKERVVVTGSTHDKKGTLSKNRPEALEVLKHLKAKIEDNVEDLSLYETDYQNGADICIISFLMTDLSCREAVKRARNKSIKINHLTLLTLLPIPEKVIREAAKKCETVIIPEENISGQYANLIAHLLEGKTIKKINKIGHLISPDEILKVVMEL